jgi:hypothetical protein
VSTKWKKPGHYPADQSLCWIYIPKLKMSNGVTWARFSDGYFKDSEGRVWNENEIARYTLMIPPEPPAHYE